MNLTPSSEHPLPWRREVLRRSLMRFDEKGVGIRAANGRLVREWWDNDQELAPTDAEIDAMCAKANAAGEKVAA